MGVRITLDRQRKFESGSTMDECRREAFAKATGSSEQVNNGREGSWEEHTMNLHPLPLIAESIENVRIVLVQL